jgi:hypothetical protein
MDIVCYACKQPYGELRIINGCRHAWHSHCMPFIISSQCCHANSTGRDLLWALSKEMPVFDTIERALRMLEILSSVVSRQTQLLRRLLPETVSSTDVVSRFPSVVPDTSERIDDTPQHYEIPQEMPRLVPERTNCEKCNVDTETIMLTKCKHFWHWQCLSEYLQNPSVGFSNSQCCCGMDLTEDLPRIVEGVFWTMYS